MDRSEMYRGASLRRALLVAVLLVSGVGALVRYNAAATGGGPITKLAAYVLENHSQAAAYAGMPYLSSLAAQYGKATNYNGVTHPSEGNYVTMISGQGAATCGLADPKPGQCNQPGHTIFGQALAAGKTAKLYQDGMSANCSASGDYGHNPWLQFPAEASQCAQFDVPMGTQSAGNLAGDINTGKLANLSMVVPNDTNNSHSGSLSGADSYLHTWMNAIFAGPDWRSGHLAVVIVFDEGETTSDVAFVVVSPTVAAGTVFAGRADHNSLERLYATVAGIAPINGGVNATDLSGPFNFTASGTPPPGTTTAPTTSSTTKSTSATGKTTTTTAKSTTTSTGKSTTTTTTPPPPGPNGTQHFTANVQGNYGAPHALGYNLHDTGPDRAVIDTLPGSDRALVWLGEKCPTGLSASFVQAVGSLAGDARVFGYYLSDEPHASSCSGGAVALAKEADYIHAHAPGQLAFIVIGNTGNDYSTFAPAKTHVDAVGLDPYPCNTKINGCNMPHIDDFVNQAKAAGIPSSKIVPTFQIFGDSYYLMPDPQQLQSILDEWAKLVPNPIFDYSYSWGCQAGALSNCLSAHAGDQRVMAAHNNGGPPQHPTNAPPTTEPPPGPTPDNGTWA